MRLPPPKTPTKPSRNINPLGLPAWLQDRPTTDTGADPLAEARPPLIQMAPTVGLSFDGVDGLDNVTIVGGQFAPPDTEGDVSPDHYIQWVNVGFKIWSIQRDVDDHPTGVTPIPSGLADNIFPGDIFWQVLPPGSPCRENNAGDPIVLWDNFARRWLFAQFSGTGGGGPGDEDGFECVALSASSDPLGSYYVYEFLVGDGMFNDYPKLGVWTDGYYMTQNNFVGNSFVGATVSALERDAMLTGGAAQVVTFFIPFTGFAPVRFSLLPAHLEGVFAPPPGTCNPVVQAFDEEVWGDATADPDGYQLWAACLDWSDPLSSTLTETDFVTATDFDAEFCGFAPCIPPRSSTPAPACCAWR
jgi:hypothetical protein